MNKNRKKQTKEYLDRHKLGQFFTSDKLVNVITSIFNIEYDNRKILEPSFGGCAFIKYIVENSNNPIITAVDIDKKLCKKYKNVYPNVSFVCHDFLTYQTNDKFDIVIGNPPFNLKTNENYYDTTEGFLLKSLDLLKEGGHLYFVMPSTILRNKQYQLMRHIILNNCKIEGIINTSSYEFLGADIETIVIGIKKETVQQQIYNYYSNDKVTLVELINNNRETININNGKYYFKLLEKLSNDIIGDLFEIYRGRSSKNDALRGRNINFYNILYKMSQGNDKFIGLQNIAYRFTANYIIGDINDVADTITILETKKDICEKQLCFYSEFLNSSVSNYLLHIAVLNNCKLTIHIDKYYIEEINLPNYDESFSEYLSSAKSILNTNKLAEFRNKYFYKLLKLNDDEIRTIEEIWSFPKFKQKENFILEVK